jgi:hypothetical protein
MSYLSIIKDGFQVTNRNWPLVLMQFIFMFVGILSWLVIVGIPLAIAFIIFGVDLTDMLRQPDLIGIFEVARAMFSKAPFIVMFVFLSFVLYLAFLTAMFVFFCSGTIGLLAKSIQNGQPFSLRMFWAEAKRLSLPVFVYSVFVGFCLTMPTMIMGILGEIVNQIVLFFDTTWPLFSAFISIFLGLVLVATGVFIFLVVIGMAMYGFGYLSFNRPRPFRAVKQTAIYMYRRPMSVIMLLIVLSIFLAILTLITMISVLSANVPLLALPFNFIFQIALWYALIFMVATLFLYYFRTGYQSALPALRSGQDTSQPQDVLPAEVPPVKEEKQTD